MIVRRSNALLGYCPNLIYHETSVSSNFFKGLNSLLFVIAFGIFLFCPPILWLLKKYLLPKPGEGPSEEKRKDYFLRLYGYGIGKNGTKLKATLYYPNDPSYVDTARMLVETGLSMAFDKEVRMLHGGYHTIASCCGQQLLDRLVKTGCTFSINIDDHKPKKLWRKRKEQ